jgi:predicted DNA-binding transcriptional regulator AlpA
MSAEIHPNQIIRRKDGPKFFGLSENQIDTKIRLGEIPKPMALSATGRARGWLGSVVLEYQAQLQRRNRTAA